MTAATASPAWTVTTDSWSLARMREAAAYRAANPGTTVEERATDAYLDAYLAACEDAAAEVGSTWERPVADEAPRPSGTGTGSSNYGSTRNAPSEAQLRYLASLARDLGRELETPRDKSHASLVIDAAKKELAKARTAGTAAPRPERTATEGQLAFLTDLLQTRVHGYTIEDTAALTFDRASALITELRNAPRVSAAAPAAHGIREGRYAFQPEGAQAIFLRVSRTGRVYTQAGPSEHPYRGQGTEALRWIAENMREAASLYGQLIGCCGRCGRELTDETSRSIGLGPDCAKKGW